MALRNVTVDDVSSLLTYNGTWSNLTSASSDLSYYNQTYHTTVDQGASVSLSFSGRAIYVYGSKQPQYDQYIVTVDGRASSGSAYHSPPESQQLLFSDLSLADGPHEIVLQDQSKHPNSRPGLDIDYIVYTDTIDDSASSSSPVATMSTLPATSLSPAQPSAPTGGLTSKSMHATTVRIVAAVVSLGVIAAVALVIFGIWIRQRRKYTTPAGHVAPFHAPMSMHGSTGKARIVSLEGSRSPSPPAYNQLYPAMRVETTPTNDDDLPNSRHTLHEKLYSGLRIMRSIRVKARSLRRPGT